MPQTIVLNHRIAFTIPTDPARSAEVLNQVAETLTRIFGGVTTQRANGHWQDANGNLIVEPVRIVYSLASERAFNDAIAENVPATLAQAILEGLDQQAVLYEVDGIGYLLEAE